MATGKSFEEFIREGILERGAGEVAEAIRLFTEGLAVAENYRDKATAHHHLGLCYQMLGDFEEAGRNFRQTRNYALTVKSFGQALEADRHLSSCLLEQGKIHEAVFVATRARTAALNLERSDLVWYTHGLLNALRSSGISKTAQFRWCLTQVFELKAVWRRERDKLAKHIWLVGIIIDFSYVLRPRKAILGLALNLSKKWGLDEETKQIEDLLKRI